MTRTPEWLDGSLDQLEVAVVLVSSDRTIGFANPEAHRLFGAHLGRLRGLGIDRLTVPERRGELRNIEDVLQGGGARRLRTVLRREDGTRVTVTATYEPCFDEHGRVQQVAIRYELMAPGQSLIPSMSPPRPSITPPAGAHRPPSSPAEGHAVTPPRYSESRLSPLRVAEELEQRLHKLDQHLRWIEERMGNGASPLDDARERTRILLVVAEARSTLRERIALAQVDDGIPAAPKVPKI